MIKPLLIQLRIFDLDGKLSLTNIGVSILLFKIAAAPQVDWSVIAGLLLTLLSYGHKRHVNTRRAVQSSASEAVVKDLESKVQELLTAYNIKKLK